MKKAIQHLENKIKEIEVAKMLYEAMNDKKKSTICDIQISAIRFCISMLNKQIKYEKGEGENL